MKTDITNAGLFWCAAHELPPLREITRWAMRKDRISPSGEQFLSWTVFLECGHIYSPVLSDFEWSPEQGHAEDEQMTERIREVLASGDVNRLVRRHFDRHLTESGQWMEPQLRAGCPQCAYRKRITSYQKIGRLTWKGDRLLTRREAKRRRLLDTEQRAAELRAELARTEAEARELREE